jgi:deazaflavin-dependent oxidoreductase (nitroreductase family)
VRSYIIMTDLERLDSQDVCYLTTIGRVTGHPHRVELWFALNRHTLYILHEGEMGDWMKNALRQPEVTVTIQDTEFTGTARMIKDHEEETLARRLLAKKYQKSEDHLVQWLTHSLAIAVDLTV